MSFTWVILGLGSEKMLVDGGTVSFGGKHGGLGAFSVIGKEEGRKTTRWRHWGNFSSFSRFLNSLKENTKKDSRKEVIVE